MTKIRRRVRDLEQEEMKAEGRRLRSRHNGLWPLDAPGMPPPGPDFLALAESLGDTTVFEKKGKEFNFEPGEKLIELYAHALCKPGFSLPVQIRQGLNAEVTFVPGHIWGQHAQDWQKSIIDPGFVCPPVDGPHQADVMILGKIPWREETAELRNLVGPSGEVLAELIKKLHIKGAAKWYITNLVKFMPPDGTTRLRAGWLKDCLPLLHQELRIVRPKSILCIGADASKALLGKKFGVGYMDGRVVPYEFQVQLTEDEDPKFHKAQVMTVLHPAEVAREPSKGRILERGMGRFSLLVQGVNFDKAEEGLDHRMIDTYEDAVEWVREVEAHFVGVPKKMRLVAWDAEWEGQHPLNKDAYLRTIQVSWAPKHAVCFKIAHPGGKLAFRDRDGKPAMKRLVRLLNNMMKGKRAVGHFLNADLEWLHFYGIDPTKHCEVPIDPDEKGRSAWQRFQRGEGYYDTAMAAHAIEETAQLGLEMLAMRYTTAPRWDIDLEDWKKAFCKSRGIKASGLEGYGECPDKVLVPYACLHRDSLVQLGDGTWRRIGELVRERYSGTVKAFKNGQVINAKVTDWHRASVGQQDWFRLQTPTTPDGKLGLRGPKFTPDHKIVTQRGKVCVDSLVPGEDAVLTDEHTFSSYQKMVFLGSLLGDGGYARKNDKRVGFGFGQATQRAEYADWKAEVFRDYDPSLVTTSGRRYVLPFSRYLASLAEQYPTHPVTTHGKRKAVITRQLLDDLGYLGLAVWYQDDGCLVTDTRRSVPVQSSRLYCRCSEDEVVIVRQWLLELLGTPVTYNAKGHFFQIIGEAFSNFHAAINPYMHPACAYKTPMYVDGVPVPVHVGSSPFFEPIVGVVRWEASVSSRGHGVRYCLSVPEAQNFLTEVGFVSNCYDSDVTLRLALAQLPLLDVDYEGNCCWEPFWESMIVQPVILDIHKNGIEVDRDRIDKLTESFITARAAQEEEIKDWAKWDEFNVRSVQQVKEFLFGEKLNGKFDQYGKTVKIRPKGAKSLYVEPLLDTSKPPRRWEDIKARGEEMKATPGTGKMILGILAQENLNVVQQINWIRDYRFLDQVLKSILRPSVEEDGEWLRDDDGNYEYEAGLAFCVDDDGRVRTHLYPTAETGRWKSSRPNLQNISKSRDPDYERLLGKDQYKYKLRSVLRARGWGKPTRLPRRLRHLAWIEKTPGHKAARRLSKSKKRTALVEFDYKGAELYGMAIMSGDDTMIAHAERALFDDTGYDEDGKKVDGGKFPHPKYYDIHSNVAVLAFRLKCKPTKGGLKEIGKAHFRTLAKNVIFGIAYGRGAKAIALQAKEQGINVTVEEAQQVIDTIFEMYPGLVPFFEEAKKRAIKQRWLCHCFGRFRRFPSSSDYKLEGEFERQAMNFPIQGMIASAVNRGLARLRKLIYDQGLQDDVKLLLQIHDAGLLEVSLDLIEYVTTELIPYAMRDCVPIYPTKLDGVPTGKGPYHLGLDITVEKHWGAKFTKEECKEYDIPMRFAAA